MHAAACVPCHASPARRSRHDWQPAHNPQPQPPTISLLLLQRQAAQGCLELDIELGTAALAFVYFERLILQGIITKTNRRLAIAVCLVLAYKWQERGLQGAASDRLPALLQWIDRVWYASAAQIFQAEFGAFSLLNFGLHVPLAHVSSHFFRILKALELPPKHYLGEGMLQLFLEQAALEEEEEGEEGGEGREGRTDRGASPRGHEADERVGAGHEDEDEEWGLSDTIHGEATLPARRRRPRRLGAVQETAKAPAPAGGWRKAAGGKGRAWAVAARALRWRSQGSGDGED